MSYTAGEVIKAALQRIMVQASEADLEADEYADAMMSLNAMMSSWLSDGIDLGYTDVDNVSDTVTVPAGAIRGIIANLALEVAPDYGGKVTAALAAQANDGLKVCRKLGINILPTQYPGNLPRGSGVNDFLMDESHYDELDVSQYYAHEFKDPDGVSPVTINWSDLMTQIGDTISSSSWEADSGLTVDSDTNTTLSATAVISGGSDGSVYALTNRVVTAGGYTYDRTVIVYVQEQ